MTYLVVNGFLKESRLIVLYSLPISTIILLLQFLQWDIDYAVQFVYLYAYISIISAEDKETLDEDIKTIMASLTTAIGCYQLARSAAYFIFEGGLQVEKTESQINWYLLKALMALKAYLISAYHIAFFRICLNSVIITTFVLAKLAANYAL